MRILPVLFLGALCTVAQAADPKPILNFTRDDIVKIYDGDTFYIDYPGNPKPPAILGENLGIRLNGIDAPEMKSRCQTNEQKSKERLKALEARAFLEQRILFGRNLELHDLSRDKYFRLDATLYIDGTNINELMVEKGYAIRYDGGTKSDHWCSL